MGACPARDPTRRAAARMVLASGGRTGDCRAAAGCHLLRGFPAPCRAKIGVRFTEPKAGSGLPRQQGAPPPAPLSLTGRQTGAECRSGRASLLASGAQYYFAFRRLYFLRLRSFVQRIKHEIIYNLGFAPLRRGYVLTRGDPMGPPYPQHPDKGFPCPPAIWDKISPLEMLWEARPLDL